MIKCLIDSIQCFFHCKLFLSNNKVNVYYMKRWYLSFAKIPNMLAALYIKNETRNKYYEKGTSRE